MIDPYKITVFERSDAELQEFLIFCIMVAGKTAKTIAKTCDNFLNGAEEYFPYEYPFQKIGYMILKNTLLENMKRARTGKYGLLTKSFHYLLTNPLDLRSCSVQDLEQIPGVGRKTARFFLVHSRLNQKLAVLDTHVVKWLNHIGHDQTELFPKNYLELEQIFIKEAEMRDMTVADLDLKIWSRFSSRNQLNIIIPFPNKKLYGG
ncbi:hypothetical protein COW57_01850 [Candidatus Roizmanbacteria bacterium CG17_big_fil_post_rev_8_21_14_2_50_39_7]|uniref:HhH-GPD domain-containing protein n=1 Tax=Candidatus Roizmanbacteria bacterium CG17_big_fil_post_rev_8_21_14_2_50_39_7 TaxID=1974858 RepID=A0A2M7EKC6_9BACT|nr:MAG: hypothetical protein COW57_01850 [Candidatus Roizmanbacteria bacterium CG17_big_fil_post_rev_8_21_14_2_50_39_7]